MPYIKQEDRKPKDFHIIDLVGKCDTVGDLNYSISKLIHLWMTKQESSKGSKYEARYATHNAAIGVLECAKLELYRRLTAPYEDKVMNENGDL